jgi:hypothetical protein
MPSCIFIPKRNKAILTWIIENIVHVLHHENKLVTVLEKNLIRVQYKVKFDRPPRLKKLPEALIISPELRQTSDRQTQNRDLDNT